MAPEAAAVEVILEFWPRYGSPEAKALEQALWLSALKSFDWRTIGKAWIDYQKNGPRDHRTNRLCRPDVGEFLVYCDRHMKREHKALPSPRTERTEPPAKALTAQERRDIILEMCGDEIPASLRCHMSEQPSERTTGEIGSHV